MNEYSLISDQLESLLCQDIASVIERQCTAFDKIADPFNENSMVLFGAGGLGRMMLSGLRKLNVEPLAFGDNNPALWNKTVDGLKVFSPQEVTQKFKDKAVFVVTIYTGSQPTKQLLDLNCKRVVSFTYLLAKYPQVFLPHLYLDLPHKIYEQAHDVRKAATLWADENSQLEYLAQLRLSLFLDFDRPANPFTQSMREIAYFDTGIYKPLDDEVFVDCGAYDGDTIKTFLQRQNSIFKRIIALEPDAKNYKELQEFAYNLPDDIKEKIEILPLACGSQRGKVYFMMSGHDSKIFKNGTVEIPVAPLDDILGDSVPTLIKMDIEGAEPDALAGASKVIRDTLPVLAVCAYHQQDHLWRIPLFIRSLSDQYRLFLRPYVEQSWDSLVCYAVPVNRLR